MAHRTIRWRPAESDGLEHLELDETADGIVARSVVIGTFEGLPFGATYEVTLASDWTFRALRLDRTDGRSLTLACNGQGRWQCNGTPALHLSGCVDIDISATPFTNTLPIRRSRFEPGVPRHFRMAWIPLESLEPLPDDQIYTMRDAGHFRYQAADGSFEAELTTDEQGLVIDYPGLFKRA